MSQSKQSYQTPRDFFLYLLAIFALYSIAVFFGQLVFAYINHTFPDSLNYYDTVNSEARWAVAWLIVVYPVYFFTTRFLMKDIDRHPEKQDMKIRKWLIYLTLFITAITIMIDLVRLINHFLSGQLAIRFILQSLAIVVIAATIFGFYYYDLKRQPGKGYKTAKIFGWAVSGVIGLTVIGGLLFVGSPQTARLRLVDTQRVNDLQLLQSQIVSYWQSKEKLPKKLSDLEDSISGFTIPKDPATNTDYGYKVIGDLRFELCATFNLASQEQVTRLKAPFDRIEESNWQHGAGLVCFERTIDPALYPPQSKPKS